MRLLHTKTLQFRVFWNREIPKYAILSHRWEEEEISFQEWLAGDKKESPSYLKITNCCNYAASRGLDWVWVDTCCIDKTSSTELSEAINTMFRWYQRSEECYAYLSDVDFVWVEETFSGEERIHELQPFMESLWFTRGWTLQELLAPANVFFFDAQWDLFGTKLSLSEEISIATGIPAEYLVDQSGASVAMKMSWAAKRTTKREEDVAYCLLGIFNVTMPLLYGEGERAFFRLQREIIEMSDDESIFAWYDKNEKARILRGVLAPWPSAFAESGDIVPHLYRITSPEISGNQYTERPPYSVTNKGLQLSAHIFPKGQGFFYLPLNCRRKSAKSPCRILVCQWSSHVWERCDVWSDFTTDEAMSIQSEWGLKTQTVYLRVRPYDQQSAKSKLT